MFLSIFGFSCRVSPTRRRRVEPRDAASTRGEDEGLRPRVAPRVARPARARYGDSLKLSQYQPRYCIASENFSKLAGFVT